MGDTVANGLIKVRFGCCLLIACIQCGLFVSLLSVSEFIPDATALLLVVGLSVVFVAIITPLMTHFLSFRISRSGISQSWFLFEQTIDWADIKRVRWQPFSGIVSSGSNQGCRLVLPSLLLVADKSELHRALKQYCPVDSPLRKFYGI